MTGVLDTVFPPEECTKAIGDHYLATRHQVDRSDCCECRMMMTPREYEVAKWFARWGGHSSMTPAVMEAARTASIEALGQAT